VHDRIERHPPEQPRRRIAQAIGRPGMSHFVERQGKQQDRERDENLRELDVYGSLSNGLRASDFKLLA